jgi:hypothetical protein
MHSAYYCSLLRHGIGLKFELLCSEQRNLLRLSFLTSFFFFNPELSGEALRIAMFVSRPIERQALFIVSIGFLHVCYALSPDLGEFAFFLL